MAIATTHESGQKPKLRAFGAALVEQSLEAYTNQTLDQQSNDDGLLTLLLLCLYYAFDTGTTQEQSAQLSRNAHRLLAARTSELPLASSKLRFLVRLYVWFEVTPLVTPEPKFDLS